MSPRLPVVLTGDRLPARLRDLPRPPRALFLRGELPGGPSVAIVGTRKPTSDAVRFASRLAADLARTGVVVLSGGACGIDTAAHQGALSAQGRTVVVAPAGYAQPFPAENAQLFSLIVERGGAYVALVPDDQVATQAAFFRRNGSLVALADVVVVVQAPVRSGARNAAAQARRLGRPVLAVPSAPWIRRGLGCLGELRRGALPCESAGDVLAALARLGLTPLSPGAAGRAGSRPIGAAATGSQRPKRSTASQRGNVSDPLHVEADCSRVVEAVHCGASSADDLCVQLGLSAARVQQLLLTLNLRGVLVPSPTGSLLVRKTAD